MVQKSDALQKICSDDMDDEDIITTVQNGSADHYDCIIERYEQKLLAYVIRFVKNPDEARDIVQNVFMKSLNNIESFDTEKKFSSWIYRIAHNETMNWFTRHNQTKMVSIEDISATKDQLEMADASQTALDEWFQIELRDEMADALEQLPEQYAEILRMKYFEDRSYKEIAQILDKPISSVGTLLRRAKKRLLTIVVESELDE
jgi:RNA polymerase sigma-70 factor (ECF subfamily)